MISINERLRRLNLLYYARFGKYPPRPKEDDYNVEEFCKKIEESILKLVEIQPDKRK